MDERLSPHLLAQSGVVSRRQALAAGLTRENLDRLLRRRELARLFPRVYVEHTGRPTWDQLAHGAVLWAWPAVLSHESALGAAEGNGSAHRTEPIHVTVTRDRRLVQVPGIVVHRSRHARDRTQTGHPPRIRYDDAAVDVVAAMEDEDSAVAALGQVLHSRRTTAGRLLATVDQRVWLPHRDLLRDILGDAAEGATSALERCFVVRVERAHGLPAAHRQARAATVLGAVYRDNRYELGGTVLIVELDGQQFHGTARQRDRDLDRDLVAVLSHAAETIRLGWGQCRGRPCRTAGLLGAVLVQRGWRGEVRPCRPGCEAPDVMRRALGTAAA